MRLSYVIVTHNRREPLLRTLRILEETTPLPRPQWEMWVVDNGSNDGTIEAVEQQFPSARIIRRERNEGVWARSYAFGPAAGQYLVLLDDDSYPTGDAVRRSIDYLDATPTCAAVVGRVVLPDGSLEACALPCVMLSGAVCIRKSIFEKVGGFAREFFRKAGEYDLSFRIWNAGYSIERFEDVVYRHDKVATGRSAAFAHRMDLRNNLILVERYLPADLRSIYRDDWRQRYLALARHAGCGRAVMRAIWEARLWRLREAVAGRRPLSSPAIEQIFELESQARAIAAWAREHSLRSVAIADLSKNVYATHRGCLRAGLRITAIVDNHPAFAGLRYRGIPVIPDQETVHHQPDGIVVSNVNPAQVDRVADRVQRVFGRPVLRLWCPKTLGQMAAAA